MSKQEQEITQNTRYAGETLHLETGFLFAGFLPLFFGDIGPSVGNPLEEAAVAAGWRSGGGGFGAVAAGRRSGGVGWEMSEDLGDLERTA